MKGNKVKRQVSVPLWICENFKFRIACVRGLMDTDGGLYSHRYRSGEKLYEYLKLCFTNASYPLLTFVMQTLIKLNIKSYLSGRHVSIGAIDEVKQGELSFPDSGYF